MKNLVQTFKIKVHPPKISPKISSIGYGNPRYNSMITYKNGILLTSGAMLRWADIKNNQVLFNKQIGCCQIFQILQNKRYVLTVNFDGYITLLNKNDLEIVHQFYAPGKQIRHSSFDDRLFAVSCELNEGIDESILAVYKMQDIEQKNYKPFELFKGHHYYPEYHNNNLIVVEYNDPNPKGRKRKDTVMNQKLPITNRIVKFDQNFVIKYSYEIVQKGQIICATKANNLIYYLHTTKKITLFDIQKQKAVECSLDQKCFPHLIEPYKNGIVYPRSSNKLAYFTYDFQHGPKIEQIVIKSMGIGQNLSIKFSEEGIYSFNENGLHFYQQKTQKTYTQSLFSITNCGLAFNDSGNLIAVADFGGNLHVFETDRSDISKPLFEVSTFGIPIRTITWCKNTNNIVVGCVGGGLYWWKYGMTELQLILQLDHTINILRSKDGNIFAGTANGQIKIFNSNTMELVKEFTAHHPIHYQTQQQRQLFGSMKNYAEIWSIALSPSNQNFHIVTSCEDQTQKVFSATQGSNYELKYHLKGHQLAVTSVDWRIMNEQLGQIYVSCSDDKVVRFRDPKNNFAIIFQIQTTTIKQWHTLTYLALQPNGHRVAIGSQNGYLFIYDILGKQLLYGQKIHLGGIEGLDWCQDKIATCSSDLCINIIDLKK